MNKRADTFEQTNAFYRRPSVISKSIFLSIASTPSPPFQCCNTLRGHFDLVTTLKRGEGVEMSKLDIEKLTRLTKQVFFGESQLLLSMIVATHMQSWRCITSDPRLAIFHNLMTCPCNKLYLIEFSLNVKTLLLRLKLKSF